MKAKLIILTVLSLLVILLTGCPSDDIPSTDDNLGNGSSSKELVFVGSYFSGGTLPEYTAKLTVDVKSGEFELSKLTDMITQSSFYFSLWDNGFVRNGRIAFYAHESNFEGEESNQRFKSFRLPVFVDVSTGSVTRCPVPLLYKNLEPWCRAKNIYIDDKGRIFYAIWYTNRYSDAHEPTIFRYDPKTNEYTHTTGSDAFVATQPEKGWDTEAGAFTENFAISSDGRYAYGVIYGFGTEGGVFHTDYKFIVQYDFDTEEITRLDGGETSANIYGINSDYSKLIYSMGSEKRYIDLQTKQISKIDGISFSTFPHCGYSRTSALRGNSAGLFLVDFTKNTETKFANGNILVPQFDKSGKVYFVREGKSENYICRKTDFSLDTPCDTIAIIPSGLKYVVLVE